MIADEAEDVAARAAAALQPKDRIICFFMGLRALNGVCWGFTWVFGMTLPVERFSAPRQLTAACRLLILAAAPLTAQHPTKALLEHAVLSGLQHCS